MNIYRQRTKQNELLDYDVFINDTEEGKGIDLDLVSEFIEYIKKNFDVVYCSPKEDITPFKDMYLLPILKEKHSTGYDISIRNSKELFNTVKRVPLGVKTYLPPDYSVEMKLRSSTFKKHEVMLTNAVGEIDSSFRAEYLAELIPIMYFSGVGQKNNQVPCLEQSSDDGENRNDFFQLKLIQVNTHLVESQLRAEPVRVVGIVCQHIWDNFSKYFPSDREEGGFGSTDIK